MAWYREMLCWFMMIVVAYLGHVRDKQHPGLGWKIPIVESLIDIEVKLRLSTLSGLERLSPRSLLSIPEPAPSVSKSVSCSCYLSSFILFIQMAS